MLSMFRLSSRPWWRRALRTSPLAALAVTTLVGCAAETGDDDLGAELAAPAVDVGPDVGDVATAAVAAPTLTGRAVLPALTFAPGPASGSRLGTAAINGVTPPFAGQPVQGFSALVPAGDGTYLAMPDNGYGAMEN